MPTHQAQDQDGRAPEGLTEPNVGQAEESSMTEMLERIALEEHFLLHEPEHVERTKAF